MSLLCCLCRVKIPVFLALLLPLSCGFADDPRLHVTKIWDASPHNAFTDLARFHDEWFCVFREAEKHVGGDGKIRVITSRDGDTWTSAALIAEDGIDLRDPKICLTPDDRLMLTMGGSVYRGTTTLQGRQPRVAFSKDGREWSAPQRVLGEGDWLWRVSWHGGEAFGVSYKTGAPEGTPADTGEWTLTLYRSSDGIAWEPVAPLAVPDRPNETTLRFKPGGECMALVRREAGDKQAGVVRLGPIGEPSERAVQRGSHSPYPHAKKTSEAAHVSIGEFLHKRVVTGEKSERACTDEEQDREEQPAFAEPGNEHT